jgi:hypothetical protein
MPSVKSGESNWFRQAVASGDRVAVVDREGRLANVGRLCQNSRIEFVPESSLGGESRWWDSAEEPDELGNKVVPMTPEYEERWRLIGECRAIPWTSFPDNLLTECLAVIRGLRKSSEIFASCSREASQ